MKKNKGSWSTNGAEEKKLTNILTYIQKKNILSPASDQNNISLFHFYARFICPWSGYTCSQTLSPGNNTSIIRFYYSTTNLKDGKCGLEKYHIRTLNLYRLGWNLIPVEFPLHEVHIFIWFFNSLFFLFSISSAPTVPSKMGRKRKWNEELQKLPDFDKLSWSN